MSQIYVCNECLRNESFLCPMRLRHKEVVDRYYSKHEYNQLNLKIFLPVSARNKYSRTSLYNERLHIKMTSITKK